MVTALTGPGWMRKGSAWSFSQGSAKYPRAVVQTWREKKLPHKPGLLVFTAELQRNGGTEPKYNGPLVTPRLALGDLSSNRYSGRHCGEKMDCAVFFNLSRHFKIKINLIHPRREIESTQFRGFDLEWCVFQFF